MNNSANDNKSRDSRKKKKKTQHIELVELKLMGSVEKKIFSLCYRGSEFWLFWFVCDFLVLFCFALQNLWFGPHITMGLSKARQSIDGMNIYIVVP